MKYATPSELRGDVRSAVVDLLFRLADDSLILGHRDSEWTGLGPILEADIAFSSMAQDKMGHALALYRLLHDLGEDDPDALAFGRGPNEYRCCSLASLDKGDWAHSVVRQFFFAEEEALRFAALADGAYIPLAALARKLGGELKYHVMHGRMWIERLGGSTVEGRARLQAAVHELYPHALGMFEPTKWDDVVAGDGIGPAEAAMCEQWRAAVDPLLEKNEAAAPADASPVYGGRQGRHPAELDDLLAAMQKVYRLDPAAKW